MSTDVAPAPERAQTAPPEKQRSENQAKAKRGQAAIRRVGAPIRGSLRFGQFLVIVQAALAIAPYVVLVRLGELLLADGEADRGRVWHFVFLLVSAYSARLLIYFAALIVTHVADLRLRAMVRREIVAGLARAPLSWFTESNSGLVRKGVQDDTAMVHTVIAHGPIDILNAVVTPIALLGYAFWIDFRLGLLSVATVPLYALTYSFSLKGMAEKTAEMDGKLAKVSATMTEFVSGIAVVKSFGRVGRAHLAYLKAADEFTLFFRNWALPLVTVSCLSFAWISIPVLLVVNLGGGALLMTAGLVTLPEVLATSLIALVLPGTIQVVSSVSWAYQMAGAAAVRLCALLDVEGLPQTSDPRTPSGHDIEIDHVSFSYGQTLAVDDVTLTLPEGSVTALLGPSGSGKSTLATLIARFGDPDSGAIRIGGVDLREMSEQTLYQTVSFVLQDAQLINAPIRDNIALGRPGATDEEIRAAARVARIDEFIATLPNGYDTVLGSDISLSGGQEQRIAIARAVLVNAPVVLLDEATAFADPESEAEIQAALSALVKGRTVLVIAHRPAAIRGADQIVVMNRGRVCAAGTHNDLLADSHYRALLRQGGVLIEENDNANA